jgi:hypothetical protein
LAAAIAEYRRLRLAVSREVNRMIAAAINANPQWFCEGPDVCSRLAPYMLGLDHPGVSEMWEQTASACRHHAED